MCGQLAQVRRQCRVNQKPLLGHPTSQVSKLRPAKQGDLVTVLTLDQKLLGSRETPSHTSVYYYQFLAQAPHRAHSENTCEHRQ